MGASLPPSPAFIVAALLLAMINSLWVFPEVAAAAAAKNAGITRHYKFDVSTMHTCICGYFMANDFQYFWLNLGNNVNTLI